MGRLFLVEFDQTPHKYFYSCRSCGAHIALSQDSMFLVVEYTGEGYFKKCVNVVADEPKQEGQTQVEELNCIRCNTPLGQRNILPPNSDGTSDELIRLKLDKLLLWNGTQRLNANFPPLSLLPPEEDQRG